MYLGCYASALSDHIDWYAVFLWLELWFQCICSILNVAAIESEVPIIVLSSDKNAGFSGIELTKGTLQLEHCKNYSKWLQRWKILQYKALLVWWSKHDSGPALTSPPFMMISSFCESSTENRAPNDDSQNHYWSLTVSCLKPCPVPVLPSANHFTDNYAKSLRPYDPRSPDH